METTKDTYLCIGGPRAGKLIKSDHPIQHVSVRTEFGFSKTTYIKEFIWFPANKNSDKTKIAFWRPEDQNPVETFELLLETYEAANAK